MGWIHDTFGFGRFGSTMMEKIAESMAIESANRKKIMRADFVFIDEQSEVTQEDIESAPAFPKEQQIYDQDGKDIGSYVPEAKKPEKRKFAEIAGWEKMLVWMYSDARLVWRNPDFMKEPHFIGYEAPNRMWELVHMGFADKKGMDGKYQTYAISEKGKEKAWQILETLETHYT